MSASRNYKQKKHVPIGGKSHHISQSQNDMANHGIWLLWAGGNLEGTGQKSENSSASHRGSDRSRVLRVGRFVTFGVFGVHSVSSL